ncbi:VTC domain-containing protein [Enhygromyxa salina]|uniref:VTC domain protein n=1 Tax=Enhygromyxa salina TaxID=215803 RepID=A0A2S9XT11_9BACT|nr:VTC domain-containing protein [Enhygromyxa salina]PRP96002.1 VTC domain protein [Enhygromyxa salina]
MTSSAPSADVQNDALIFADRVEDKYFLDPAHARAFVDGVTRQIGEHRFRGHNANTLPRPVHYVTTLYFDSQSREIARACERGDDNVKLRAREYYDEHPDLTEVVTSRSGVIRREPLVWLEVKARVGVSTRKVRFSLPSPEVGEFLSGGVISEKTLAQQRSNWGPDADQVFEQITQLCTQTEGPLRPDCLAHYRRRAWQDPSGSMRVTLDTRIGFYRPPVDMFSGSGEYISLRKLASGPPITRLPQYLVELKLRDAQPDWLRALISSTKLEPARVGQRTFSKFLAASRAVHQT